MGLAGMVGIGTRVGAGFDAPVAGEAGFEVAFDLCEGVGDGGAVAGEGAGDAADRPVRVLAEGEHGEPLPDFGVVGIEVADGAPEVVGAAGEQDLERTAIDDGHEASPGRGTGDGFDAKGGIRREGKNSLPSKDVRREGQVRRFLWSRATCARTRAGRWKGGTGGARVGAPGERRMWRMTAKSGGTRVWRTTAKRGSPR